MSGNVMGGGGHGRGRNIPGKSEFPSDWSDEKAIEVIKEIANDPASVRSAAGDGGTRVKGTRDGVDIEVFIGRDRKTIVTAYPTNTGQNSGAAFMSTYDWRAVKADLSNLSIVAPLPSDMDKEQIKTLIDVGEYDIALDNISYFYLKDNPVVPPEVFEVVEKLATALDTEEDPEFTAVARLLAAGRSRI